MAWEKGPRKERVKVFRSVAWDEKEGLRRPKAGEKISEGEG